MRVSRRTCTAEFKCDIAIWCFDKKEALVLLPAVWWIFYMLSNTTDLVQVRLGPGGEGRGRLAPPRGVPADWRAVAPRHAAADTLRPQLLQLGLGQVSYSLGRFVTSYFSMYLTQYCEAQARVRQGSAMDGP